MKKFTLIICFIVAYTLAIAQSNTNYVSVIQAYPLVTGQTVLSDQSAVVSNSLYPSNVILDNLPQYEIRYILPQTVYYMEDGIGFYIKADSLHSNQVRYSFTLDHTPIGVISLDSISGRFNYYPNIKDYQNFTARFVARTNNDSLVQKVLFTMMPSTVPEEVVFKTQGIMPSADEYTIIAKTSITKNINYQNNREAWSYSISGKDIIFDNQVQNKVWGLSGRSDIYELNIYAERVFIRSALHFPQTNVTIYAKELIFEDVNGVVSSINTSAEKLIEFSNGTGKNGGDAGNITVYIKELKCNYTKRFIANGENGQSANRNGTPGNGGNGGVITSTLDIENFSSVSRGGGGVKFNVDGTVTNPDEIINANVGDFISVGQAGIAGTIGQSENTQHWLHPYFVSAVLRHINDAYINLYNSFSELTCNKYYNYIEQLQASEEWNDFDEETKVLLRNQQIEISTLLNNLNNNLDYFGNSQGWVPLLSFEVLLENFNNEIDRAIPTLYLSYWLNHVDRTLAQWVSASSAGAAQTELDIEQQRIDLDKIILDIPVLQDKIIQIIEQREALQIKIDNKYNELLAKAKDNVSRKNRINKAFGIAKGILSVIPTVGPALSTAVGYAHKYFGPEDKEGYMGEYANSISGVLSPMIDLYKSNPWDDFKKALHSTNWKGFTDSMTSAYDSISKPVEKLSKAFDPLNTALAKNSAPEGEVAAELAKLMAESPEWNSMQAEMTELKNLEAQFMERLKNVNSSLQNLMSGITSNILTLDGLRRDAFTGNSKRDLQAMQYLSKMEQNAKNRLQKYFYYARKAYEYRLLKPYTSEFSLNTIYKKFEDIGTAFNENNPVDYNAYSSLASVYRNEISSMIESILDEYVNPTSMPAESAPIYFTLSKKDLETLNKNKSLTINMFQLGFFDSKEENVRIVDFDIYHIEKHNVGKIGMTGYLNLNLEHSGISRLRKNGEVYWFNHIAKSGINPHRWGIRTDAITNNTTVIKPTFESQSLLRTILGKDNNIMLYSRPSAWSDITITKNVHTQGGGDIVIDSVIIKLVYDYTPRPNNIRNIDINVSDGLMPFIVSNETDLYGKSSGKGNFHRAFTPSTQTVSYEAPQYHGAWRFVNWTNRLGQQVTANRKLTISRNTDQYYTANYEYCLPILQVADTIYVSGNGGMEVIPVKNIGIEDMEWSVSDSESNWVQITGNTTGLNNGNINIMFSENLTNATRIDSIYIEAPETDIYAKTIYIVQRSSTNNGINELYLNDIKIYPNPVSTELYVKLDLQGTAHYRIFNAMGQIIMQGKLQDETSVINVNSLSNGIYYLNIEGKTIKFIKN